MPAVNPARLRSEIDTLLEHYGSPKLFHLRLHDLFSRYANRALRFGEESQRQPLMRMFHLPDPLMRQLKLDLNPMVQTYPTRSLDLSDELWRSDYFEIRLVAGYILSRVPVQEPASILDRLEQWLTPDLDKQLAAKLLSHAAQNFGVIHSQDWESFLATFLIRKNTEMAALGVIGFHESLIHAGYSNLPLIFRTISPLLQDPTTELMAPLRNLFESLAGNYPEETLYFIKQSLTLSESPIMVRLIKQCLPFFKGDLQDQLKAALR